MICIHKLRLEIGKSQVRFCWKRFEEAKKGSWVARLRHMNGEAFEKNILRKLLILKKLNIGTKNYKKKSKEWRYSYLCKR